MNVDTKDVLLAKAIERAEHEEHFDEEHWPEGREAQKDLTTYKA